MALTGHPRLFLTPAVLARAKARVAAGDARWLTLKAQADQAASWDVRPANYAVAYAVTGNSAYADRAIQLAGVFIGQGVGAVEGDSGFPCRQVLPEEAITYDFCYDRLSPSQRSTWQGALEDQCRWVWPETNPARAGQHGLWVTSNYYWGFFMSLLAACALLPERPFGQTLIDQGVARFQANATPRMQPGGKWEGAYLEEGTSYGYGSLMYMAQMLGGYFSATGAAPGTLLPASWIPSLIRATIHLTAPDLTHLYPGGDQARVSSAPVSDYTHAVLLPLLPYATPEDAGMARFWIDQTYADRDRVSSVAWEQLLFYPDVPAIDYRPRLGTHYSMPGVGVMSTRGDWSTSAVQVVAVGGPVRDNDHDDDTGTFYVRRGADTLAGMQKIWGASGGEHKAAALNCITIDGKSQPGKQDGTHVLLSQDTPAATQWAADLTAAYPNDLNEWRRDLMFLKQQGILVVLDRVNTKNAGAAKRWLCHTQNAPTLGSGTFKASAGGSDMSGVCLLPANASITQEHLSTGSYRINVQSPVGKSLEHFLHVLQFTASGQPTKTVNLSQQGGLTTVLLGSQVVTVDLAATGTTPALKLSGDAPPPPGNQPPIARAGGPYTGVVGQPVQFNGIPSTDPDGTVVAFAWRFGGGAPDANSANPSKVFNVPGTYTVTLTVTDDQGATATDTTTATIRTAPAPPPQGNLAVSISAFDARAGGAAFAGSVADATPLPGGSTLTATVRTPDGRTATATATIGSSPPPPPPPPGPSVLLADDFSGTNPTPGPLWTPGVSIVKPPVTTAGVSVAQGGGVLTITPVANASAKIYNGIQSAQTFDFTGASATVEVKEATKGSANTQFALVLDGPQNFLLFETEDGSLYASQIVAGMRQQTGTFYSATAHRFWRIRHDAASDKVWWETSADGATWSSRRSAARPFAVTALRLQLAAGSWQAVSTPGRAIFDNVKVERLG